MRRRIGIQARETRIRDPDDGCRGKRRIPASARDVWRKRLQCVGAVLRPAAGTEKVEKPFAGNVTIAIATHFVR
jgi:hypothetical protein